MNHQSASTNIIALEIGSSKIRLALGTLSHGTDFSVVAVEEESLPADLVRYGVIRNVEKVAGTIDRLMTRLAARTAPRRPQAVYVALGGRSLCSFVQSVERQLPDEMDITSRLVDELKADARAISRGPLPGVDDLIEVVPLSFTIDGIVTSQPEGEVGRDIIARFVILAAQEKLRKNIERVVVEKLGLHIVGFITRPLAIADFVMTGEERRLGSMFVDFGAETTTIAFYKSGALQYIATLPIGSRLITRDIMALHYLEEQAESLKRNGGHAAPKLTDPIIVGGVDFKDINNYVAARSAEIIANIRNQMNQAGLTAADLPAGIIITGGGAKLHGFNERLGEETKMKVRSGIPAQMVRILDSSIIPGERLDILACLAKAAENPVECLSALPEPEEEEILVEEPAAPVKPVAVKKPAKPAVPKKPSLFTRVANGVVKFMQGPEEDDLDELNDDE